MESFCSLIRCSLKDTGELEYKKGRLTCIDKRIPPFLVRYTCRYIDRNGRPHGDLSPYAHFIIDNEVLRISPAEKDMPRTRLQIISALAKSGNVIRWKNSAKR